MRYRVARVGFDNPVDDRWSTRWTHCMRARSNEKPVVIAAYRLRGSTTASLSIVCLRFSIIRPRCNDLTSRGLYADKVDPLSLFTSAVRDTWHCVFSTNPGNLKMVYPFFVYSASCASLRDLDLSSFVSKLQL